ncbi:MAG: DUF362 domain-containing protein [Myxococcota bacterium]|jgi:uncharacterized protein (DUF362 family)|nr:DUF362 domain-containing protein [Myxococcota bacterium]
MSQDEENTAKMDRRTALKVGVAASSAVLLGLPESSHAEPAPPAGSGRIVRVHLPGMRGKNFPHAAAAKTAVDKAVMTFAGASDFGSAWKKYVKPDDRVGIKINVLGGKLAATNVEVVEAIVAGVRAAGVPDENILIFDQFGGSIRSCRYTWQDKPGKLRCLNHEALGFASDWTTAGPAKGKLAKTLTWCTAVISVPVIKDHGKAGVTCALKNMAMGCVEQPHLLHQDIHNTIPQFYNHEDLRGRVRLIVADGSFAQYDGGPKQNPSAISTHDSIYVTTDPVAMDAIARELIDALRVKNKMRSLEKSGRPATFIENAAALGLGIADLSKIKVETVELPAFSPTVSAAPIFDY